MRVVLRCEKMKDGPEFDLIRLVVATVDLEDGSSSLVVVPDGEAEGTRSPAIASENTEPTASSRELIMLAHLAGFGLQGASGPEWQAADDQIVQIPKSSFYRVIKALVADGRVEKFDVSGKPRYRVAKVAPPVEMDGAFVDDGDLDEFEW